MAPTGAGEVRVAVVTILAFARIAWSLVAGPAITVFALAQLAADVVIAPRKVVVDSLRAWPHALRDAPPEEKRNLLDVVEAGQLLDPPRLRDKHVHWRLHLVHGVASSVEPLGLHSTGWVGKSSDAGLAATRGAGALLPRYWPVHVVAIYVATAVCLAA